MLFRSLGFSPVIWFTQIRSPSPSGYCGAISWIRQSGVTYTASSRSAAMATAMREERLMR